MRTVTKLTHPLLLLLTLRLPAQLATAQHLQGDAMATQLTCDQVYFYFHGTAAGRSNVRIDELIGKIFTYSPELKSRAKE